jgi:hypothetical protein
MRRGMNIYEIAQRAEFRVRCTRIGLETPTGGRIEAYDAKEHQGCGAFD